MWRIEVRNQVVGLGLGLGLGLESSCAKERSYLYRYLLLHVRRRMKNLGTYRNTVGILEDSVLKSV